MAAAEKLVTQHLDLWATAIKRKSTAGRGSSSKVELYGIKKLRELILELAVRGLLVPQDPNDEPAGELLKRIAAEKARLVKEGKIKKEKPLAPVGDDEKYFDAPATWEWCRLQEVCEYIQRGKGPAYADFGTVRVVSQKCVQWSGFDISCSRFVDDASLSGYKDERFLKSNDLLWNSTGTGTVGRANVLSDISEKSLVADSHVTVVRPLMVGPRYLYSFIWSPGVQTRIEPEHEKSLVSGSTQQVELNTSSAMALPVPIPPLNEQVRIVAKVDELMALCDQLGQQTQASLGAHQTLVATLLNALTSAADHAQFAISWRHITEHFDTLFTTEESLDQLKQIILQLAVMGKLVPQDPSDEPASELLKKIADEKAKLVKDKAIKKEKELPPVSEQEELYEQPNGWSWARFGSIVSFESELVAPSDFPEFEQVAPDSIEKGTGKLLFRRTVADTNVTGPNNRFYAGQILYSKIRPSLSKAIIAEFDGLCSADMYPLRVIGVDKQFLLIVILSEPFLVQVRREENRIKMPKLNIPSLSNFVISLPPLKEQLRIVAKVDELLALCDKLKVRLADAQTTQLELADALAEQALVEA